MAEGRSSGIRGSLRIRQGYLRSRHVAVSAICCALGCGRCCCLRSWAGRCAFRSRRMLAGCVMIRRGRRSRPTGCTRHSSCQFRLVRSRPRRRPMRGVVLHGRAAVPPEQLYGDVVRHDSMVDPRQRRPRRVLRHVSTGSRRAAARPPDGVRLSWTGFHGGSDCRTICPVERRFSGDGTTA